MKPRRRARALSSTTVVPAAVTVTFKNDNSTPDSQLKTTGIPIVSPRSPPHIPITVHFPTTTASIAATKIQSTYRSHTIRTLYKKISAVNAEADNLQRLIQRQETVDAVRSNDRERIKMNEGLMSLLLRLDSVPGLDPTIRELRRQVSRRIVGLQEIMDAVSGSRVENWDGYLMEWDDVVERMEEEVCKEIGGGYEMEKFCAEKLGFRCLQRFLRDQ